MSIRREARDRLVTAGFSLGLSVSATALLWALLRWLG